jgi:hypothetical protein
MTDAKIEIKVGNVSFSGEGQGEWLSKQLDKVLAKLPELASIQSAEDGNENRDGSHDSNNEVKQKTKAKTGKNIPLATFLKDKKATTNNVRKFLATALWLHDVEGKDRLTTTDVTKALSDHKQGSLGNASQKLANNAEKGHVERQGNKLFYVTDQGRTELGE